MSRVLPLFYQGLAWLWVDTNTTQFLKARNARVTVTSKDGKSFHTLKLSPVTHTVMDRNHFLVKVKVLPPQKIRIVVSNTSKQETLVDITVPFDLSSDSMNLDLDDVHVKIDLNAESSMTP